jgi:hypothetical protein
MSSITLFAVAAAIVATGVFGVWAASPSSALIIPSMSQGVEPLRVMMNAKDLPTEEFVDYTFVFAH